MVSPKPSISCISSAVACSSASIVGNRSQSNFAAREPMPRIPSANTRRSKEFSLEAAMARTRFSADFSAKRSSSVSSFFVSEYKSATECTRPFSCKAARFCGPSPSMFMASLETKWIMRFINCAGQSGFGQRMAASSGSRTACV